MLVVIVLLPLFLGILQLALVLHVRNTLVAAAAEGARYGATADRGPSDAVARTREQIRDAIAGRYADGVAAHEVILDGVPTVEVRVEATVPALGLGGPGIHVSVAGHAIEEQP